jgi:hypothetical protein
MLTAPSLPPKENKLVAREIQEIRDALDAFKAPAVEKERRRLQFLGDVTAERIEEIRQGEDSSVAYRL